MKMIKLLALSTMLTLSFSCAHHGKKCHGKSHCDMKKKERCSGDKEQCKLNKKKCCDHKKDKKEKKEGKEANKS